MFHAKRTVGAVVLNWKNSEMTSTCLESIRADPNVDYIVIVDNESNGELQHHLRLDEREVLLEQTRNLGFSAGINVGLTELIRLGVEFSLVINNDAALQPNALSVMARALEEHPEAAACGPTLLNPDHTVQAAGGRVHPITLSIENVAWPGRVDFLTFACVLLRNDALKRTGLLDERFFMYWEDVELGYRLRAEGFNLVVAPDAIVTHAISSSHKSAGIEIHRYSALGLAVIGRLIPQFAFGSRLRLVLKLFKQILRRDIPRIRATHYGWRLGRHINGAAYEALGK